MWRTFAPQDEQTDCSKTLFVALCTTNVRNITQGQGFQITMCLCSFSRHFVIPPPPFVRCAKGKSISTGSELHDICRGRTGSTKSSKRGPFQGGPNQLYVALLRCVCVCVCEAGNVVKRFFPVPHPVGFSLITA